MLARSLFEDTVAAQWAVCRAAEARELFPKHLDHSRDLYRHALRKHDASVPADLASIPPLSDEERASLDREFGPHGNKLWTRRTIFQMIQEVQPELPIPKQGLLWQLYDESQRINNLLLHHSPFALNQPLVVGPSEQAIAHSLQCVYSCFSLLGTLLVDPVDRPQLDRMVEEDAPLFVQLPKEVLASTRRNDPCPCNSGRKFKYCHGR